jgi:hypothetical protein
MRFRGSALAPDAGRVDHCMGGQDAPHPAAALRPPPSMPQLTFAGVTENDPVLGVRLVRVEGS